ncbi:MAG: helix-hairpin-helix domain-containing protein [Oscillospiraceae bacterium]|nr:helix-hairpin-helix domain-containing protein [Oscillospiraceae bacterium]
MNEDEKISRKMLILMFILCLIAFAAVAAVLVFYSPKEFSPSFSGIEEESVSENPLWEESSVFPLGINTATAEDLQLIPDIGPATAKLIIDYRNEYGTIVTFRELLSIEGIGEKTVELLKEYCIIN